MYIYSCVYILLCVRVCVQTSKRFSVKESRARAARKLRCLRLCLCARIRVCVCVRGTGHQATTKIFMMYGGVGVVGCWCVCVCGRVEWVAEGGYGRQSRWLEHEREKYGRREGERASEGITFSADAVIAVAAQSR